MDVPNVQMKCVYVMSGQRQGAQLKHRAHKCDILPLSFSPQFTSQSFYHSLISSLCVSLTQNIQAQLIVTMTAVAITLVSHESPHSQAQVIQLLVSATTMHYGCNTSGERLQAHPRSSSDANEHTHTGNTHTHNVFHREVIHFESY